ncbi:MAG: glutamate--cysteine ligase [Nitrospirota bacterium]|jgi:carboxylate-amine ligase
MAAETIHFQGSPYPTIGVEVELQLIDATTGDLSNSCDRLLAEIPPGWGPTFKPELFQSNLEINTGICETVADAEQDLAEKLALLRTIAARHGVHLAAAGTHPFASAAAQVVTDSPRYHRLLGVLQRPARRLNIFGLHVHIGVATGEIALGVLNRLVRYLPHLLALSANSPYWEGEDTGLASMRVKVFEALSTAGLPFYFQSWKEFETIIDQLRRSHTIDSIRDVWWDIRPHPDFGTIEVRICDTPGTLEEILSLAAFIQCLVARASRQHLEGEPPVCPHSAIARENKWRAARYGLSCEIIRADTLENVPAVEMIEMEAEQLRPLAEELRCADYLARISRMAYNGSGADVQRRLFAEHGDLATLVAAMSKRFNNGFLARPQAARR